MPTIRGGVRTTLPPDLDSTARKLWRALQGQENFTGLRVSDQRVEDFLNKTNGSALNDPTALGASVVETGAVAANAINVPGYAFTSAGAVISADETVVQTLAVTTTGSAVEVTFSVLLSCGGAAITTASVFLKRDATTIWSSVVAASHMIDTTPTFNMLALVSLIIPDTPSAGAHTYDLCVSFSDYSISPQAQARGLGVHQFKDAI